MNIVRKNKTKEKEWLIIMTNKQYFTEAEVYELVLDYLENELHYGNLEKDSLGDEIDESELHHELFNTDYYIIGIYKAKKALEKYGVFEAIEEIKEYEIDLFNEIYTDFSEPEKVASMLWYIISERIINEMEFYSYDTVTDVIEFLKSHIEKL